MLETAAGIIGLLAVAYLYAQWQFGPDNPLGSAVAEVETYMDANLDAKVRAFAEAIAFAEGFGANPNNVPTSRHNPGDLGPGDTGYPGDYAGGSIVSYLPDDETGWRLLHAKISKAFTGQSHVYNINMTVLQFARNYAGDWMNWANNVSNYLGISPDTRIADWLNMA